MSVSRITNGEVDVEFINEFRPVGFDALANVSSASDSNPVITPHSTPILAPMIPTATAPPIDEKTAEERRKMIRESWVKRFESSRPESSS
jgi:hypothetical protein